MVRILKDESIDKDKIAFMLPVTPGACRLLGYPKGQRMVLDHLGYSHVPLVNPTTRWKEGKELIGKSYMNVERLLYLANIANELLLKRTREIRPYEVNKGETNAVYDELFRELIAVTRRNGSFDALLRKANKRFGQIRTRGQGTKPIVGILGEIYVRMTPFANGYLEDEIERLGGEVWIIPLSELLFFRNKWFIDYHLRSLEPLDALSWMITDRAMKYYEHKYERYFKKTMKNPFDSIQAKKVQDLASPYVYRGMWGETVPNIGRMVELIEHKMVQGIINVGPFACMPTTLGNAIAKRVLRTMGTFPFMTMSCEGLEKTNALTRIEAFMFQAYQFMRDSKVIKADH
jgi:predicted nucleotide-binding protein (sugar kinase/HSP70/actin superfamily)